MNESDGAVAVSVGVGIAVRRGSVCSPPCVSDPQGSIEVPTVEGSEQFLELPRSSNNLDLAIIDTCHPGGVVAAVLKLRHPIEEHGQGLLGPDIADDAAHEVLPSQCVSARSRRARL